MTSKREDQAPSPPTSGPVRRAAPADASEGAGPERAAGLERIREILLGDILVALERRLARLDGYIASRSNELQQDVRHRTDVLEAHVRREIEATSAREAHDTSELSGVIRAVRQEHRDAVAQLERRLEKIEARVEESVARVERETREQLLAQAKSFIEELDRVRDQLRSALVLELGIADEPAEEGGEHAGARPPSHH